MLHRKIKELIKNQRYVNIFMKDHQVVIERAQIISLKWGMVTVRYETEDEEEICSWEDVIRIDGIGSISEQTSSIPKYCIDVETTEECPECEWLLGE